MKILAGAITLLLVQVAWWGSVKGGAYQRMMPRVQGTPMVPKPHQALAAYAMMVLGFATFVLPCMQTQSLLWSKLMCAFMFGVVLGGVHNFCNAAVLTNWDMTLGMLDILWTGTAFALAAWVTTMV